MEKVRVNFAVNETFVGQASCLSKLCKLNGQQLINYGNQKLGKIDFPKSRIL
ncbi:MAG: hypothetical protein RLZZ507_1259 [Cyanobacteriota bacterium]|jgi:hypothetical protein